MAWTQIPPQEEEPKTLQPKKLTEEEIKQIIEEKLKELRSK